MPFLLAEILNFQGSTHLIGVGSLSKLFTKSFGPNPNEATAMDGSTKYLVSEVLIAVLDRKFGFQAGESSITKILAKAFKYEYNVSLSNVSTPLLILINVKNPQKHCIFRAIKRAGDGNRSFLELRNALK